jgi:hypothetical protein
VLNSSRTWFELSIVSVLRKPEYSVYQTGPPGFGVWVLKWILYESTSRGSLGYCYSLLWFIKWLEVYWISFEQISLTKSECPILIVLIPLRVLLNFRIAYSPTSRWHQGTFSKSLIHFSYVIWVFTYHIVELDICLVVYPVPCMRFIESTGTRCGVFSLVPWRPSTLIR